MVVRACLAQSPRISCRTSSSPIAGMRPSRLSRRTISGTVLHVPHDQHVAPAVFRADLSAAGRWTSAAGTVFYRYSEARGERLGGALSTARVTREHGGNPSAPTLLPSSRASSSARCSPTWLSGGSLMVLSSFSGMTYDDHRGRCRGQHEPARRGPRPTTLPERGKPRGRQQRTAAELGVLLFHQQLSAFSEEAQV